MNYIQVDYVYEIQIIIIVLILDNNTPYLNLIDFTHYILSQLQFTSTIFHTILYRLYRLYIYKMTNKHSHFMATQIQAMKKSEDAEMLTDSNATNNQDIEKKKKKKKKKKSAYKNLLKSIKKSSRTEEQKKDDYKQKISQSLGGGDFGKISRI